MNVRQAPPAIVVGIDADGTGQGSGALRYAIGQARARGSWVRMVHVAPSVLPEGGMWPTQARETTYLRRAGQQVLDRAVSNARTSAPDVQVAPLLGHGPVVPELVAAAADGALVVLGRESRRGLERLITGATTLGVTERSSVPVVVVPADWEPSDHGRVVVGVKSPGGAGELLSHAFATAAVLGSGLRVVHVEEAPVADGEPGHGTDEQATARMLETAVREWSAAFPEVEVETFVLHDEPAAALLGAATDGDILVLARHHRDLRHLVRLGPVPRAVLSSSTTPVEIVPLSGSPETAPLVLERSGAFLKT
ncbi:universal stress protein [Promicromonospora sp. NPDC050880]|uniref:universal stress protein n=1 Tax=Promicromonospora sp. NPDC050880 TaxID=3364406 RepID=UPI0037A5B514